LQARKVYFPRKPRSYDLLKLSSVGLRCAQEQVFAGTESLFPAETAVLRFVKTELCRTALRAGTSFCRHGKSISRGNRGPTVEIKMAALCGHFCRKLKLKGAFQSPQLAWFLSLLGLSIHRSGRYLRLARHLLYLRLHRQPSAADYPHHQRQSQVRERLH
jgi:hypothetical protein